MPPKRKHSQDSKTPEQAQIYLREIIRNYRGGKNSGILIELMNMLESPNSNQIMNRNALRNELNDLIARQNTFGKTYSKESRQLQKQINDLRKQLQKYTVNWDDMEPSWWTDTHDDDSFPPPPPPPPSAPPSAMV